MMIIFFEDKKMMRIKLIQESESIYFNKVSKENLVFWKLAT